MPDRDFADSEAKLQTARRAVATAQANELTLYRRLLPYLDAEIQNRDAEIEELKARVSDLEDLEKSEDG
ncbi:MAG: hypothetical protein ACFB50_10855 [Rubrobacteraceae bacterium]